MARLKEKYNEEIAAALKEKFQYDNVMQIPKLVKIVVNMGLGEAIANPKALDAAVGDMTQITGQKPVISAGSLSGSCLFCLFLCRTGPQRCPRFSHASYSFPPLPLTEPQEQAKGSSCSLFREALWRQARKYGFRAGFCLL